MRHRRYDGRKHDNTMVHWRNNRNRFLLGSAQNQPCSSQSRPLGDEYVELISNDNRRLICGKLEYTQ